MRASHFFPALSLLTTASVARSQSVTEHTQLLLGPVFPPPHTLPTSASFSSTLSQLSSQLETTLATGSSLFGNFTANASSISISIVSTAQESPIYTFRSTSSFLNTTAGGTVRVGDDSVFRIGSISKLFTVYALLLNGGFARWNDPVTDYVPELRRDVLGYANGSEVDHVMWEEVTLGSLASFMSGIGRDFNVGDLSTFPLPWAQLGLPQLAPADVANCSRNQADKPCTRAEYFKGFTKRHPIVLPQSTPIYSNTALRILAYAMEAITGLTYEDIINESIIKPLGLTNTSLRKPQNNSIGVIPQGNSFWDYNVGDEGPSGGIYSTASDLATLGRNILLSSQLTPNLTRRWLKPLSHTAALTFSVGAPWEIWRTRSNITNGRTVDLYTKGGSIGLYESNLILIPDYQVAISLTTAGPNSNVVNIIDEMVLQTVIPALERAAKEEAARNMTGRYASNAGNSSMVLDLDDGPGLVIETWISNGSDLLKTIQTYASATNGGEINAVRLYPTDLIETSCSGSRAAYKAVFESAPPETEVHSVIDHSFSKWQQVDQTMYGNVGVDDFVFDFDASGVAIAVESRVLKSTLKRQSS